MAQKLKSGFSKFHERELASKNKQMSKSMNGDDFILNRDSSKERKTTKSQVLPESEEPSRSKRINERHQNNSLDDSMVGPVFHQRTNEHIGSRNKPHLSSRRRKQSYDEEVDVDEFLVDLSENRFFSGLKACIKVVFIMSIFVSVAVYLWFFQELPQVDFDLDDFP